MKITYIATVQIIIHPNEEIHSKPQACDWFSGLLSDNEKVIDWQYLKIGNQICSPTEYYMDDKEILAFSRPPFEDE